ncbi:hypothetical protein GJ496_000323 [Pomphorhynchus laevis]|nr:hypothetical protein GJ496_000323 [Pomphorhynchus laevis]
MTIELVRQGNYGKAMKRISSSRLAPFTEQTHRKLTDLHPPGKGIITSIPTAEHVDIEARSIGPWIKWFYSQPSKLRFGAAKSLTSSAGVQQGDPMGPFLFALAIQPIIRKVDSVTGIGFNKWYLDDGIIIGEPKAVAITLNMIANELEFVIHLLQKMCSVKNDVGASINFQKSSKMIDSKGNLTISSGNYDTQVSDWSSDNMPVKQACPEICLYGISVDNPDNKT